MTDTPFPQFDSDAQRDTPHEKPKTSDRQLDGDSPVEDAPPEASPQSELERLQAELEHANDRILRTQAELENFRKRQFREMADQRRYAQLPLLRDVLPVVDNLDRAIQAAEGSDNAASLLEGVKLVASQLASVFQQHHCLPIQAETAAFDPHLHEAISQVPSDTHPEGTVVHVSRVGYRLHDRVVRASQVVVSTGTPAAGDVPVAAAEGEQEGQG